MVLTCANNLSDVNDTQLRFLHCLVSICRPLTASMISLVFAQTGIDCAAI